MTIRVHEKLLLTGAAGGLGQALRERLKANCQVLRLSDRADVGAAGPGEEVVLADLADAAAVDAITLYARPTPGFDERVYVDSFLGFVNVARCADTGTDNDVHGFS